MSIPYIILTLARHIYKEENRRKSWLLTAVLCIHLSCAMFNLITHSAARELHVFGINSILDFTAVSLANTSSLFYA